MRVVDSSVLIKYFSREKGWGRTRSIIAEGVATLDLALKELANALRKKILRGEMSVDVAVKVLEDLVESKAIPVESQEKYLVKAFKIAVEHGITVYDALFIVFAAERHVELATSDRTQCKVAETVGVKCILV